MDKNKNDPWSSRVVGDGARRCSVASAYDSTHGPLGSRKSRSNSRPRGASWTVWYGWGGGVSRRARAGAALLPPLVDQLVPRREVVQRDPPQMVVRRPVPAQRLHVREHRLVLFILRDVEIADRYFADHVPVLGNVEPLLGYGVGLGGDQNVPLRLGQRQ